jgi:hypothetical protein
MDDSADRAADMPETLSPERALERLRELSTDVHAAVLLGPAGEVSATPAGAPAKELAQIVGELMERADSAAEGPLEELEVTTPAGAVFAARRDGWTLAAVTERAALASLMLFDIRSVMADLGTADEAA